MHDKLVSDIAELESRRDAIKAKVRLAKAQQDINKVTSKIDSSSSFAAFQRIEDKADAMLDMAQAEAELNSTTASSEVDSLSAKYDATPDMAVQDELAALKAKLGTTSAE
jgi:phage shock protein A